MNNDNITSHQTIILGLYIFLDQWSSRPIDQKFVITYPLAPPSLPLSVFPSFFVSLVFLFVFQPFCPSVFLSLYLCVFLSLSLFILVHLSLFVIWYVTDGWSSLTKNVNYYIRILQYIIGSLYVMCVAAHKTSCLLPWHVLGPELRNFQRKYLFRIC